MAVRRSMPRSEGIRWINHSVLSQLQMCPAIVINSSKGNHSKPQPWIRTKDFQVFSPAVSKISRLTRVDDYRAWLISASCYRRHSWCHVSRGWMGILSIWSWFLDGSASTRQSRADVSSTQNVAKMSTKCWMLQNNVERKIWLLIPRWYCAEYLCVESNT